MTMNYTKPTITTDQNGSYIVSVRVDGKRYKKRISIKNSTPKEQKAEAKELVDIWVEMLEGGLSPFNNEDKGVFLKMSGEHTLRDVLHEYYLKAIVSANTLKSYKYQLNKLDTAFGDKPLNKVTVIQINELLSDRVKDGTFNQKSLNIVSKVYRTFFNWCVTHQYLRDFKPSDIGKKMKSDKDSVDRLNPFDDEHFVLIMDKLKSLENQSLYYFCCFIYHGCLRINELRGIKIKDIDLKRNRLTVQSSIAKNSTKQDIPIYPALRKIIDKMGLEDGDKNHYIFGHSCLKNIQPYYSPKQISPLFFGKWFREVLKDLDLYEGTGYSAYCFKHKSCIDKLNSGYKVAEISRLCRHSNVNITLEYLAKISKVTPIDHLDSVEI